VDFEREAEVAREAARAAGEIIARYSRGARESWDKAEDSPVTAADLAANRAIGEHLAAAFPQDAILSEETRDDPTRLVAERLWVVDPLDGTKEFIEGVPEFAVSIGLVLRGEPVVGVVYQPLARECFWGVAGGGAFLDSSRLTISTAADLASSVVLSSRTEEKRGQLDAWKDWFGELRPIGSVALKLAWIAAARGDLWVSAAPKSEWDVCAGDLLVREAGGVFVAIESGPRAYNQRDVLLQPPLAAGPAPLVDELNRRCRA
jgi:myo-inositol-1(or 4)-monophosphatase